MFQSILFPGDLETSFTYRQTEPTCFHDLNLDQIIKPIVQACSIINLAPLFYSPLHDPKSIRYRQEVFQDLEHAEIHEAFLSFTKDLLTLHQALETLQEYVLDPESLYNDRYTRSRILGYALRYLKTLRTLQGKLKSLPYHAAGLLAFAEYFETYLNSEAFLSLEQSATELQQEFSRVSFCCKMKEGTLYLRPAEGQKALDPQVQKLFSRFQGENKRPVTHDELQGSTAHHIDAALLDLLARWHKDLFDQLNHFVRQHLFFIDPQLVTFSQELQFYFSWLKYLAPLKKIKLPFCYPKIHADSQQVFCKEGFDLALAKQSVKEKKKLVVNDFKLQGPEQILVITGPNQGGKTTFARAFGQIFYLASLGLLIPGSEAELCLVDEIYTHFNREEDLSAQDGKLQDDLLRLKAILDVASDKSLIVLNEIFSSTTLEDALFLGDKMLAQIIDRGCLALLVTFLDELATYDEHTVSMMSTVDPKDPVKRTFRIIRKEADGLAYARHLAEKYELTFEDLNRRLKA